MRHAPISFISFKKQRVGISTPASLEASRTVAPFGASIGMPFTFMLNVSIDPYPPILLLGNSVELAHAHACAALYALLGIYLVSGELLAGSDVVCL